MWKNGVQFCYTSKIPNNFERGEKSKRGRGNIGKERGG